MLSMVVWLFKIGFYLMFLPFILLRMMLRIFGRIFGFLLIGLGMILDDGMY